MKYKKCDYIFKDHLLNINTSKAIYESVKSTKFSESKKIISCKICGISNEYLDKPNQKDGTHICYSCRN